MNTHAWKKSLSIGIILLFIGVAVIPSINSTVVKASSDNDLVKVTSQACGIQGFGNTTVKLTKEQYQNLERYLVDFRARLNQTSTRGEGVPIFKDAVVELNKYGLLPKGMSVNEAQKLVTGQYEKFQSSTLLDSISKKNPLFFNGTWNLMCLVAGVTSARSPAASPSTLFLSLIGALFSPFPVLWMMELIIGSYYQIPPKLLPLCKIIFVITTVLSLIGLSLMVFSQFSPLAILNIIIFGAMYRSTGWIKTAGLEGTQQRSGEIPWHSSIIGFTGIKIRNDNTDTYSFLGFALISHLPNA
jgi:hypothetical protein